MQGAPVGSSAVRVLVVSEDPLVRGALSYALEGAPLARVAGQLAPSELAERPVESEVDVVLWDFGLDSRAGLEAWKARQQDDHPVLALVSADADVAAVAAAGASGVLSRDAGPHLIQAALVALNAGLVVLERPFVASLVRTPPGDPEVGDLGAVEPLTPREREVLGLVAEGLSNKEIGARLGISEHTAKFHVNAILGKLGAQKRVEAVIRAARLGIVDL